MNIDQVLSERGKIHGSYPEQARISQETKDIWCTSPGWKRLSQTQKETLDMIAIKVSRVLAGDPNHDDHWIDIEGYAKLVQNGLNSRPAERKMTPEQEEAMLRAMHDIEKK